MTCAPTLRPAPLLRPLVGHTAEGEVVASPLINRVVRFVASERIFRWASSVPVGGGFLAFYYWSDESWEILVD